MVVGTAKQQAFLSAGMKQQQGEGEKVMGSRVGCFECRSLLYCLAGFCFPFAIQILG